VARSTFGPLPSLAPRKTLDSLGREKLLDYQKQNYVAPATMLAVGGRITHREAAAALGKFARKFVRGARPCCAPAVSTQTKPALGLLTKKTEQNADRPGRPRLFAA